MHELVLSEINGTRSKAVDEKVLPTVEFTYERLWNEQDALARKKAEDYTAYLKELLRKSARRVGLETDIFVHANRLIDGEVSGYPEKFTQWLDTLLTGTVPKAWDDDLVKFFVEKRKEI
jgi:hypothetical protein